jgi:hypothetical protein
MVPFIALVAPLAVLTGLGLLLGRRAHRPPASTSAAASWAQTAGTVLSTTMKIGRVGHGRCEVPVVIYAYQVDGLPYQSFRVRAADDTGRIPIVDTDPSGTLERYPVGSNVTVFYDPDDPANAALER